MSEEQNQITQNQAKVTVQENGKLTEKYYIEVNPSAWRKFFTGLLGGLGWGIGLTLGTSAFMILIGFLISKIDFVPVLGTFFADVIKSAQSQLLAK